MLKSSASRAFRRPALLCTLALALCVLACIPFASVGANDDFSYMRSAKALADTGHLVYFGWSSAMLGWQLLVGALFIKLFGFSYTVVRCSMLAVALFTTFLLHRTFVRCGLSEANSSFATLTLVLSPLFLPLSFSFMSDIPGLLTILLSFYLCIRALQASSARRATAWLIFAALASALLGTARQTGWLGAIVAVPCACWLLRRRRLPFVLLGIVWMLCMAFILGCLWWFNHQLNATVEGTSFMGWDRRHISNSVVSGLQGLIGTGLFLLPIFAAFTAALARERKRFAVPALAGLLALGAILFLRLHSHTLNTALVPTAYVIGNYVTSNGTLALPAIGDRPILLGVAARVLFTWLSCVGGLSFLLLVWRRRGDFLRRSPLQPGTSEPASVTWPQLLILLGPTTLAYCAFLFLRVLAASLFDRYMLPLLVVLAVLAMRFYQERISPRVPRIGVAVLILLAAYGIASTHDLFAVDRARAQAIRDLRAAGLARNSFYGGFDFDGWTQIDNQGYISTGERRTANGLSPVGSMQWFAPCGYSAAHLFPSIQPRYAVSYDDSSCSPQTAFPPVPYRLWLPPFSGSIFIRAIDPRTAAQILH